MAEHLGDLTRTHTCGALRADDVGADVTLLGWVHRVRDLGGVTFVDVRDRAGISQVVVRDNDALMAAAKRLRSEYVIGVIGVVQRRSDDTVNPKIATGEVEVLAREIRVLNEAKTPPFQIAEESPVSEDVRLRYRYLDLRRPRLQHNIGLRHRVTMAVRKIFRRQRLLGNRDADSGEVDARGRARFPRAEPPAPGRVLRAAAIAADLQADPDGVGDGPLFPDRALLPRRGSARGPPARVHADRRRDVVRASGERLRHHRAADARRSSRRSARTSSCRSGACRTRKRSRPTGPTSRICAAGWRSTISRRCFATRSSACSSRSWPRAASCAGLPCRAGTATPAVSSMAWSIRRSRWGSPG